MQVLIFMSFGALTIYQMRCHISGKESEREPEEAYMKLMRQLESVYVKLGEKRFVELQRRILEFSGEFSDDEIEKLLFSLSASSKERPAADNEDYKRVKEHYKRVDEGMGETKEVKSVGETRSVESRGETKSVKSMAKAKTS